MQLSELRFKSNSMYGKRAKILLGGRRRLYVYTYQEPSHKAGGYYIYLNAGRKSFSNYAAEQWEGVDELTAQCVLLDVLARYPRRFAWLEQLVAKVIHYCSPRRGPSYGSFPVRSAGTIDWTDVKER